MKELLFHVIEYIALGIGVVGILIILLGCLRGFYNYLIKTDHEFPMIRIILGSHLILGLDFLVGKDVIDTILLEPGPDFNQHLISLITIVVIRIVLSFVVERELKDLRERVGLGLKKK